MHSLLFALWDEEEITPGMYGSRHFADSVAAIGDSVAGVVNFEMLGWDGDNDNAMSIHIRSIGNSEALAEAMTAVNATYSIGLEPIIETPGSSLSDHSPFWDNGYGALMQLHDAYNDEDPNYHSYRDHSLKDGVYAYRLQQIDIDGMRTVSHEQRVEILTPKTFALGNNFPNPFNPSTHIRYVVGTLQHVSVTIVDVLGRRVATLVDDLRAPGAYVRRCGPQARLRAASTSCASGPARSRRQKSSFCKNKPIHPCLPFQSPLTLQ